MGSSDPVVVLGGGPAGLCAAWGLAEAGRAVCVVEALDRPGGLCRTVERDGFRFDLGGHRLISRDADLVHRVRRLMGAELLERERASAILFRGRRYHYPLQARDLAHTLPWGLLARSAGGYARARARRRPEPRSFEDWATQRFGRPLYDAFFGPYTGKLWGLHPAQLSADWAAQRISAMNLSDAALRVTRLRRGRARGYARRYLYPRLGMGMLFERLVDHLRALGVVFLPHTRAVGLRLEGGRAAAVDVEGVADRSTLDCSAVVSSIPLQALGTWVQPDTASAARALGHRGLRFLNVALHGPPTLGATWCYVSEPRFAMTRIQEPLQRSPHMAPAGCSSLMLEVPCDPGSRWWEAPDSELLARAVRDLDELGLPIADRVAWCFSVRAPAAYPVYRIGYRPHVDRLLAAVDGVDNLHTIGRQGLFRYVFMDTAMEMGLRAAEEVCRGGPLRAGSIAAVDDATALQEALATTA